MYKLTKHFIKDNGGELVKPVTTAVDNLANPLTKTTGKTIAGLFDMILGAHVNYFSQKLDIFYSQKLEAFRENTVKLVQEIPSEKLVEPPLSVVGPAIKSAEYYIEAEELSKMFTNLIAASFNVDTIDKVHPSFTEIIKQLSPLDAKNLSLFIKEDSRPLCDYRLTVDDGYISISNNIFLDGDESISLELHSTSITNLIRLGLLESPSGVNFTDKKIYQKFKEHSGYLDLLTDLKEKQASGEYTEKNNIKIEERTVYLTPFGKDFVNLLIKE